MADVRRIGLDEVTRHFEALEDPRSSVSISSLEMIFAAETASALKRMTELERDVKQRLGLLLSDLAKHEVERYVLEARLWLERAKSH